MKSKIILFGVIFLYFTSCNNDEPKDPFEGNSGFFEDSRDGNEYKWIRIGEQIWMGENLAYLPEVYTSTEGSEDEGKENNSFYYVYGYYGNEVPAAKATRNYDVYGVLYNWKAAMNSCPPGWHLPTDGEWIELEGELGLVDGLLDYNVWRGTTEGGMLKETGTSHWETPNEGATDAIGFSSLPGGTRGYPFSFLGTVSYFHTSSVSEEYLNGYIHRSMRSDLSSIFRSVTNDDVGKSVRCVKDK